MHGEEMLVLAPDGEMHRPVSGGEALERSERAKRYKMGREGGTTGRSSIGGPLCTLHPAPCTLHPAPCTLHPALCTLHPAP